MGRRVTYSGGSPTIGAVGQLIGGCRLSLLFPICRIFSGRDWIAPIGWAVVKWSCLVGILWLVLTAPVLGQQVDSMPWYDAESGSVVPVGVQDRNESTLGDRNSVPLKQPAPKITRTTRNWNFNWNGVPELVTTLIWIGGGLLLMLVIGLAVWAFLKSRFGDGDELSDSAIPSRSIEESIKQLPLELQADGGNFLQLARDAYRANDLARAVTLLFSHVLVQLDQRGAVRLKKGKTNRQYLSELRPYQSLANYYTAVMVQFEKSFFGNHPVPRDEFEQHWNQLEGFERDLENTRLGTHE